MESIVPSTKIYIGKSIIPNAGRGVFALVDIKTGEVIEQCPVIEIPQKQVHNVQNSILINYNFAWGNPEDRIAICLGFGSVYNHSYEPNATYIKHVEQELINFVAIKEIKRGEEITVNYNHGNQYDKSPLWMKDVPGPHE
ncbi:MAG: SET domain-containing protein-lysine N-methyltransferase [Patescibacteria group bacterium]|nr:SET domain-containing protein-lysine N-methyltransferase [Patescibacteria group bacterium]MDE2589891.1 SET domain-containing protein-lysine N-methyltransferase [Patescibacteria group bacterium]